MNYHQVRIDPTAHIAPHVAIAGNVAIGKDCTIFANAALRGDYGTSITMEEGSNLQENSCVHVSTGNPVTIGRNATIGHGAIIHGCSIGDNTLIGMGSIIMDRACIGKNCVIGAGALVTEDTVIPDNSLAIGSPAKVRRALSETEIQKMCVHSGKEYAEIGRDMEKNGLMYSGATLPRNQANIARAE